jgi:lycopene cyclase domain-containing protein
MTYFAFLAQFVGVPIAILLAFLWFDRRRGKTQTLRHWPVWAVIGAHMLIALVYTTPWDNYLVATGVWSYDPSLVTGIVFGWVPLEEYVFFLLQPILTGLWLVTLMRYIPLNIKPVQVPVRAVALSILFPLWIASAIILISGWKPGTYLGLELIWALPPIMLQVGFGGDILWKHRRYVLTAILTATLYLALADTLAITAGTWEIDPAQSLPILIGGVLPIEELVFFLITNVLIVMGTTLMLSPESHQRAADWLAALKVRYTRKQTVIDRS